MCYSCVILNTFWIPQHTVFHLRLLFCLPLCVYSVLMTQGFILLLGYYIPFHLLLPPGVFSKLKPLGPAEEFKPHHNTCPSLYSQAVLLAPFPLPSSLMFENSGFCIGSVLMNRITSPCFNLLVSNFHCPSPSRFWKIRHGHLVRSLFCLPRGGQNSLCCASWNVRVLSCVRCILFFGYDALFVFNLAMTANLGKAMGRRDRRGKKRKFKEEEWVEKLLGDKHEREREYEASLCGANSS